MTTRSPRRIDGQQDQEQRQAPGIEIRHARSCAVRKHRRCNCSPRYRAEAYDRRHGRRIYRNFASLAEAKAWRADAQVSLRKGTLTAARSATFGEAAQVWLARAAVGSVRNRSGDVYKPSVVRGYEQALRLRVLPEFGSPALGQGASCRSAGARRPAPRQGPQPFDDPQHAAAGARDLSPGRRARRGRRQPDDRPRAARRSGRRERIASPEKARQLLAALEQDGALWATALYSGLRMGELRALEWDAVDFDRGLIHVRRTWHHKEGPWRRSRVRAAAWCRSRRSFAPTSRSIASRAGAPRASCSVARPGLRSTPAPSTVAPTVRGSRRASSGSRCTSAATRLYVRHRYGIADGSQRSHAIDLAPVVPRTKPQPTRWSPTCGERPRPGRRSGRRGDGAGAPR